MSPVPGGLYPTPPAGPGGLYPGGLYPTPPELMRENAFDQSENSETYATTYGASDWYTWRVANWGTKWDAYDGSWVGGYHTYGYHAFSTAWSPPEALIQYLAEKTGKYLLLSYLVSSPGISYSRRSDFFGS
jgi:hypothetical protein